MSTVISPQHWCYSFLLFKLWLLLTNLLWPLKPYAYIFYSLQLCVLFLSCAILLICSLDYLDGWVTFWSTLSVIGILTGACGDLASSFGCTIGLKDSVNAITFVALGTSLPGSIYDVNEKWAEIKHHRCKYLVTLALLSKMSSSYKNSKHRCEW